MATVPSPRVWSIGDVESAARLNTEISTALTFLLDPPHCAVFNNVGTSIPDASVLTLVPFDSETDDTDSMHSTVTQTSRITFNTPGRYEFTPFITLVAATYTAMSVNIRLNAAGVATGGTSLRTWPTSVASRQFALPTLTRVFAAADYIEMFVSQTSGAARLTDVAGQYCTGMQARWIGIT